MKTIKHILGLTLFLVATLNVSASSFLNNGIRFMTNEDDTTTVSVVNYRTHKYYDYDNMHVYFNYADLYGKDVIIPGEAWNGGIWYKVTKIDDKAFFGAGIKSVVIPNSIECIGDSAFSYNDNVIIEPWENEVERSYQNTIESFMFPASVKHVGKDVFTGCNLKSITVPSIDWWLNLDIRYSLPSGYDLYVGNELVEDLVIPDGVESIRDYCFAGCKSIKSIDLPNSVKSVGVGAFKGSGVEIIKSFGSLETIGESMFENSVAVSISILEGIKTIGNYAFSGCKNLESISLPESLRKISSYSFYNNQIKRVTIPSLESWCKIVIKEKETADNGVGVTSVPILFPSGGDLFIGEAKVENLIIPNSIDSIYSYTFANINSLKSLNFGDSVKWIGPRALFECRNLETIELPNSLQELGNYAFLYCFSLKKVVSHIVDPQLIKMGTRLFGYNPRGTLWVPKGTIEKYKAMSQIFDRFDIKEIADSDVNGDLIADVRDVTAIINSVLNGVDSTIISPSGYNLYDVNHDGEVDVRDVTYAIDEVLGER